jgi:hypothetical protein
MRREFLIIAAKVSWAGVEGSLLSDPNFLNFSKAFVSPLISCESTLVSEFSLLFPVVFEQFRTYFGAQNLEIRQKFAKVTTFMGAAILKFKPIKIGVVNLAFVTMNLIGL